MTTLAEQMEAEALAARMKALDWLAELADLNDVILPAERRKKELIDNLKQYMALGGMDELYDGEHGVTARFQDRKGSPQYDLISAAEQHPEAVVAAAQAGMLSLDGAMLKRLRDKAGAMWADRLAAFEGPGKGSSALIVKRDEK